MKSFQKQPVGHRDIQTTLNYYVHLLDKDKIATATAMGSFLAGVGFASSCSESCSEKAADTSDNIIPIEALLPEKFQKI